MKKSFKTRKLNLIRRPFWVDKMGILLHLYAIADYSYVGGGWQGKVHSVIEPAFFKIPILTGS